MISPKPEILNPSLCGVSGSKDFLRHWGLGKSRLQMASGISESLGGAVIQSHLVARVRALEDQGDLLSRLIMGISRATICPLYGLFIYLPSTPDPPSMVKVPRRSLGSANS